MSIPARSFGQLDSKTEYLSVARGAVLLYSGKTRRAGADQHGARKLPPFLAMCSDDSKIYIWGNLWNGTQLFAMLGEPWGVGPGELRYVCYNDGNSTPMTGTRP